MRRLYMLDGPKIEFEMEGPGRVACEGLAYDQIAPTFIDPSLGGSGYLRRIADELHLVARRALEHLDHPGCDSAIGEPITVAATASSIPFGFASMSPWAATRRSLRSSSGSPASTT